MELEVTVLLILAAQLWRALKVSIMCFSIWLGLLTHTILDLIILSDNESVGTKSNTDFSSLDIDFTAKRDSNSPHVADNELMDGDGFGSGTTHISDRVVADDQDDDNNNNSIVDGAKLQLSADCPRSASSNHGSVTHQASKPQVNTDITQRSTNYVNLDVTKEVEDEGNDDDDDGTCSIKRSMLSTVSCNNPAFSSNISKLQDSEHGYPQPPRLGLAVASLYQSDLKNDHLLKHLRRRDVTRNVCRKRPRTTATIRLASTVPAALESIDLKEPLSRTIITASDQEQEIHDIDSNDEDYGDMNDATGSKIGGRLLSRKQVRRTKDIGDNDVEAPSTHYLDVSDQVIAATSSSSIQESEEIPIYGYFTLKTIASKVVYCLTFSQELLPHPQDRRQRQDCTTSLEGPQSAAPVTDPNHQWEIRKIIGQKMVGCERHYRVEWKDTWMPESELAGAKELVDAFTANDGSGTRGRKRSLKRCRPAAGLPYARGGEEPKKRRGRPRKQV
jgi:hypothetical protein